METLERLERRIRSTEELGSVVSTMKSLSAVHIRQYERSVQALRRYTETVELGLRVVLRSPALAEPPRRRERPGATGLVVFGSDYGLCGQFNDEVVDYALGRLEQLGVERGRAVVAAVGARAGAALRARRLRPRRELATPGSVGGIEGCVRRLLSEIDAWQDEGVGRILLAHHEHRASSRTRLRTDQLLPVELSRFRRVAESPWPSRRLPTFSMAPERLLSALLRHFFSVTLFRALAESAASEHATRLQSMQAAERNIDEKLEELGAEFRRRRQDAITAELLDIVSGYEALSNPSK